MAEMGSWGYVTPFITTVGANLVMLLCHPWRWMKLYVRSSHTGAASHHSSDQWAKGNGSWCHTTGTVNRTCLHEIRWGKFMRFYMLLISFDAIKVVFLQVCLFFCWWIYGSLWTRPWHWGTIWSDQINWDLRSLLETLYAWKHGNSCGRDLQTVFDFVV